jgi:hypothetical protein
MCILLTYKRRYDKFLVKTIQFELTCKTVNKVPRPEAKSLKFNGQYPESPYRDFDILSPLLPFLVMIPPKTLSKVSNIIEVDVLCLPTLQIR